MNKKTLFLVITLTAMLILVTSVNAATDNTNTSTTHSISEKTTTTEPVVKEVQKQEKRPEKRATKNDKKIIKENKTIKDVKKDDENKKIFNISSGNNFISNINALSTDNECNYYIFNFTNNIDIAGKTYLTDLSMDKYVQIEGNGHTLSGSSYLYPGTGNYIINNVTTTKLIHYNSKTIITNSMLNGVTYNDGIYTLNIINTSISKKVQQYADESGPIIFENCYINAEIRQAKNDITFDDYCTFGPNTILKGNFIINDTSKIIPYLDGYKGDNTIQDQTITSTVNNFGNLNITQSTISNVIHNYENMTINNSIISYESTTKTGLYNHKNCEIENTTISSPITNYENITINNLQITVPNTITNEIQDYIMITNYGTMNLKGNITSTFKCLLINKGNLNLDNNAILTNITINEGDIITKTIKDANITQKLTILAKSNITIINSNINAKITNNGNLTLQNCSLSNNNISDSLIENNGFLSMTDCIIENNTGNGVVVKSTGNLIFTASNISNNTCFIINIPTTNEVYTNITNNKFENNKNVIGLGSATKMQLQTLKEIHLLKVAYPVDLILQT